jgi:lysophospholipase L1-like esterase
MFARRVAIGDSTTAGLGDPLGTGGFRGWADRLAERLAHTNPNVQYANLAIRGRLAGQVAPSNCSQPSRWDGPGQCGRGAQRRAAAEL